MHPYLVRSPIVDPQGERSPSHIEPKGLPRERLLEDALAEIARKEEAIRFATRQRPEKSRLGDAEVLGLVYNCVVERRRTAGGEIVGETAEHISPRHRFLLCKAGSQALEYRPEDFPLLSADSCLAAEARDIPIRLPGLQLP